MPKNPAGVETALKVFHDAAERVPAYRDFLSQHRVDPAKIKTLADFVQVPATDKDNYFRKYRLDQLSWDGKIDAKYISTSSGSTGEPMFWPRGQTQDELVNQIFQPLLGDLLGARKKSSLLAISFGLGTWIAGFELYNAAAQSGCRLTTITPGIDKAEVIKQVKQLAPLYEQTIVAGYPPFVKDIIETGAKEAIDWSKLEVRLLTAGEAISEAWRDWMLQAIGRPGSLDHVINYYGMAETGTVGHETPATIWLRRQAVASPSGRFGGHTAAAVYQYRDTLRFFESAADDHLLLTSRAGLPLIRYNTRDRGGLVQFDEAVADNGSDLEAAAGQTWRLPFVYLYGRRDLSVSLYAVNIYPENIKAGLEDPAVAKIATGMFVMETKTTDQQDQYLEIQAELRPGQSASPAVAASIARSLLENLRRFNSEYNKLYDSVGENAVPKLILKPAGELNYVPGRKHKWAKRA